MNEKKDTRYILQHSQSGFYVTSPGSYSESISNAKLWEPNNKRDELAWKELTDTKEFDLIRYTKTTTEEYDKIDWGELK